MTTFQSHPKMRSNILGLMAVAILPIACAAFAIGLTFAPCHSSICVEHWFPFQTRIHIAVFYGGISIIAIYLVAWSKSKTIRSISNRYLHEKALPLVGARISVGGLLASFWIIAFTLGTTGYWLPAEVSFWLTKGINVRWTEYMFRVTWAGVTGHWCDILFGLVFLPVGRNSVISTAFHIQSSTLLLAHKLLAYTLCAFGLIHGLLYYSFLAAWVASAGIEPIYAAFNPDNPFYTWKQVEQLGPYGWFVLPTGALAGIVLIPLMLVTALPVVRRNNYNTFYYVHVIFALIVLVVLCLHASTNFYFILPGLLLWIHDWGRRVQRALFYKKSITVENAGNDWYRMRLPKAFETTAEDVSLAEKALPRPEISAMQHPLETYYVHLSAISKVQIHPFTAAMTTSPSAGPTLLFQKSPPKKKVIASDKEWTWKLGALVDRSAIAEPLTLEARIEGPYIASVPALYDADQLLAIVGGTGITGALSLANWWISRQSSMSATQQRLKIVWSIRDANMVAISEIQALQERLRTMTQTAELQIHISSQAGRMNPQALLGDFVKSQADLGGSIFVYISGPEGLAASAETACVQQRRWLRAIGKGGTIKELDWYNASFTV